MSVLLSYLSVFSLSGCGKDNIPEEYKAQGIHVNKTSLTLKVGDREQLSASVVPAVAHPPALQWSSADESVATVDDGLMEAVAAGETSVTVAYQDVSRVIAVKVEEADSPAPSGRAVLYESALTAATPELSVNGLGNYTADGLRITAKGNTVQLNKFYAMAERMAQYKVKFSADAKAVFKSSQGDFNAYVDVPNRRISIATNPVTEETVDFLQGDREYTVEIYHVYQQAKVRIVDEQTGEEAEITAVHDGQGGCGAGALQAGFSVGMQWDHYCFGLVSGTSVLVKQMTVYALKGNVKLLIYGDSITQPEGYFPTMDFPLSWTQRIIGRLNGNAASSGRGGGTINTVLEYIKNELPFVKTKYVMVTIGTNGGNTAANLSELVEYIQSQGAIPILNNIPCNESGTQIAVNQVIHQVRQKYSIKGCRFDFATSLNGDGQQVDKSTMYWENYTNGWGEIYHHPNEKGGQQMFDRTLIDLPEIYE
ncbi:MAG: Ig-like domain-containing protein [Bacteroidales bacterium]|nr:Ig-like domain-containing protein [Bacteroidales bacterium]